MSCHAQYFQRNRQRLLVVLIGSILLGALMLMDMVVGSSELAITEVLTALLGGPGGQSIAHVIVWEIRLPMTLTAILVGMALALAGLQIQNITGNALASPSTLGITSAASFGAAVSISLGLSVAGALWLSSALMALIMAIVATVTIYALSRRRGMTPQTVILSGVVMNFFFLALQQLLIYWSSPEVAQMINGWIFGNLERATWLSFGVTALLCMLASVYLMGRIWAITAITLGEERAMSLGVPVKRLRAEAFFVSAVLVAGSVAFIGTIGFIGLVAPHMAKLVLGEDQRFLLPGTLLAGGLLMVASSIVAKCLSVGAMLPVGIVTSLVGVPFLLFLMLRQSRGAEA